VARGIHGTVSMITPAKHSLLTANVSTSIQMSSLVQVIHIKDASKMASLLHVNMSTCIIICTNDYEFLLNSQTVSH